MEYNIYIETQTDKFNILNINDKDLRIVVDSYEKGERTFFLNGEKYSIANLHKIKIIEFTNKEKFYNIINKDPYPYGGLAYLKTHGYIENYLNTTYYTLSFLMKLGSDVTSNFIKGNFGLKKENMITPSTNIRKDIFLSHSNEDEDIAEKIISIINKAYNIEKDKIRCTSVPGYKLPIGSYTDEQLRDEILSSKVFIALITKNSIKSIYVQFELGARWGQKLPLFPLIYDKKGFSLLEGPLRSINALDASKETGMIQFIKDLGKELRLTSNDILTYYNDIKKLTEVISK